MPILRTKVLKCHWSKEVLNPTCPSQTPLVEEGVHRRCSQMPFAADTFQNYKIRLEPYNTYLALSPSDPDSKGQPTFSKPLDPSLVEAEDGDLVEEVEMDPHIAERRWIVSGRAEDHP
jgi:hypothetical protein